MREFESQSIYRDPEGPWWKWIVPRKANSKEIIAIAITDVCTIGCVYETMRLIQDNQHAVAFLGVCFSANLFLTGFLERMVANFDFKRVFKHPSANLNYDVYDFYGDSDNNEHEPIRR